MSEPRRLFRTTVSFTYYSLAKDWQEADSFASDAAWELCLSDHTDTEEADGSYVKSDGWDEKCLVYKKRDGTDTTLGEALKNDKEREEAFRKTQEW